MKGKRDASSKEGLDGYLRSAPWYASADSAPPSLTERRPRWLAPSFLGAFAAVSAVLIVFAAPVAGAYDQVVTASVVAQPAAIGVPMRLRLMFWALLALFPLFQPGRVAERLLLAIAAPLAYLAVAGGVDRVVVLSLPTHPGPGLPAIDAVAAGILGYLVFACLLLVRTRMPADHRVKAIRTRRWHGRGELALALVISLAGTWLSLGPAQGVVATARRLGGLGGLGPGIMVFFPVLTLTVTALGVRRLARERRRRQALVAPASVAVLVPAYNEERIIAACILSLDAAAKQYRGSTHIYVVDNASRDRTAELARSALASCTYAGGRLLQCPARGKSKALNLGLASIEEPIVIRVDADTRVSEGAIAGCVQHFSDPRVGAVGGLPLPDDTTHYIGRMRAVEVYTVHGLTRIGWAATDVMLGVPGMFAGYRRSCLHELGGFAEGMNGEDTDIAMGIARLGYTLVSDPSLVVWTEVPSTLAQLREQRLRWFRAGLHVFARNRSAIFMLQGIRSLWGLPWSVLQTTRRSVLIPLLLYALLSWALDPGLLPLRNGAALVAVLAATPLLLPVLALLLNRKFVLLTQLPGYTAFRLLRAYLTLDSMFTLQLRASTEGGLSRPRREPRRGRRRRGAQRLGTAPQAGTLSNRVVDGVPRGRHGRGPAHPLPNDARCRAGIRRGRRGGVEGRSRGRHGPRSAR